MVLNQRLSSKYRSSLAVQSGMVMILIFTAFGITVRAQGVLGTRPDSAECQKLLGQIFAKQQQQFTLGSHYAEDLSSLHVTVPPHLRGSLFLRTDAGDPGYIAELCQLDTCWMLNDAGEIFQRRLQAKSVAGAALYSNERAMVLEPE